MNSIEIGNSKKNLDKLLLKIFNYGLKNIQPRNILHKFITVKKNTIFVKESSKIQEYKNIKKIFIVCIGKASTDMAESIKKIFSKSDFKVSKGVVIVNKENFKKISGFNCFLSGHPIPNKNGLEASNFLKDYLTDSGPDDLVLIFVSGGGSALLPSPVKKINLNDKIKMNRILIESGANIKEINTVRKHLSDLKGGNLLKFCFPSRVHCFILSDVIGDDLSSIASGLTVPDNTFFKDAKKVLTNHNIWNITPKSIQKYINIGLSNKELETPKKGDPIFLKVKNTLIGSNMICLQHLKDYCNSNKINSSIWKTNLEEDVKNLAKKFVKDLKKNRFKKPIILISGGESTVNIKGKGKGGRNQEFSLHLSIELKKNFPFQKYSLLSVGTDGKDGPTDAAGAILNQKSIDLIKKKGIKLETELLNNNSYEVLHKIKSLVIMNGTNTNVADVQLLALI